MKEKNQEKIKKNMWSSIQQKNRFNTFISADNKYLATSLFTQISYVNKIYKYEIKKVENL